MGAMTIDSRPLTESLASRPFNTASQGFTHSWILWCASTADDQSAVYHQVNEIFSKQFSFYPELEWKTRYPPPQGHEVRGAWRDDTSRAFAFLMDNPGMKPPPGTSPLLLHCAGVRTIFQDFLPHIEHLNDDLKEKNGRQTDEKRLQARLKQADASKSLNRLIRLTGLITAVITVVALYLRKLPPPDVDLTWFARAYVLLRASVFLGALVLLLLFIILAGVYMAKMGYLLLRKL
jgi:hypothetical protein